MIQWTIKYMCLHISLMKELIKVRSFTESESEKYNQALDKLFKPTGEVWDIETGTLRNRKAIQIVKNLLIAANELDYELCTIFSRGIKEGAQMNGNRYEELMDYIDQAESYLKELGVDID